MFKKILRLGFPVVLAVVVVAGAGWGDVPMMINFQGRLDKASMTEFVAPKTLSCKFEIGTAYSGTCTLTRDKNATGSNVYVDDDGIFNVRIGDTSQVAGDLSAVNWTQANQLHVLITGLSGGEIKFDQPFTSTPYAITARNVFGGYAYINDYPDTWPREGGYIVSGYDVSDVSFVSNYAGFSDGFRFYDTHDAQRPLLSMRLDKNKNILVGIGTKTPQATLDVGSGTITAGPITAGPITAGRIYANDTSSFNVGGGWLAPVTGTVGDAPAGAVPIPAIFGVGNAGNLAGQFDGNVLVNGNLNTSDTITALKFVGDGSGLYNVPGTTGGGAPTGGGQWNLSGSNIYNTNTTGNVGIGTDQPGARLHVDTAGLADTDKGFRMGGNGEFVIDAPGVIGGRLSVLNNGNVGIGTTSPITTLDVNGNLSVGGGVINTPAAEIRFIKGLAAAVPVKVGSLTISSTYDDNAPADGLYVRGNVGIGTTAPSGMLEISQNTNTQMPLHVTNISTTGYAMTEYNSGGPAATASAVMYVGQAGTDVDWQSTGKGSGIIQTSGNLVLSSPLNTPRLVINTLGKVGIGTASPTTKLDVNGYVRAYSSSLSLPSGGSGVYTAYNGASGVDLGLIYSADTSKSPVMTYKHLKIDASPLSLNAASGGNVGIGTSTPNAKLEVGPGEVRFPGGTSGNPDNWNTHFNYQDGNNYIRGTTIISDPGGGVALGNADSPIKVKTVSLGQIANGNWGSTTVSGLIGKKIMSISCALQPYNSVQSGTNVQNYNWIVPANMPWFAYNEDGSYRSQPAVTVLPQVNTQNGLVMAFNTSGHTIYNCWVTVTYSD